MNLHQSIKDLIVESIISNTDVRMEIKNVIIDKEIIP